jgi:pectinesterase
MRDGFERSQVVSGGSQVRKSLMSIAAAVIAFAIAGCGTGPDPVAPNAVLDSAPPQAPLGLRQSVDAAQHAVLEWNPNSESDLGGYQIYQYSPDPSRDNAYVLVATVSASTTTWAFPAVDEPLTTWMRMRALDAAGNRSAESASCEVHLNPPPAGSDGPEDHPHPKLH